MNPTANRIPFYSSEVGGASTFVSQQMSYLYMYIRIQTTKFNKKEIGLAILISNLLSLYKIFCVYLIIDGKK